MYNIAICDDDTIFLDKLKVQMENNVEFTDDMEIYLYSSGQELIKSDVEKYNMLIIDMCLGGEDGFLVAKLFWEKNSDAIIVFCSGIMDPKPEHFEVMPYRYMIKRLAEKEQELILSDCLLRMKSKYYKAFIEIANDGIAMKESVDNILMFSSSKRGSVITVIKEDKLGGASYRSIKSNQKLCDWYSELKQNGFEFPHSSYLVNLRHVRQIKGNEIIMSNGEVLGISRKYKRQFQKSFSLLFTKKYKREKLNYE